MEISENGINLIKHFEGCRLVVYNDAIGLPTVGYGHRTNLAVGTRITQSVADAVLKRDLEKFCAGVQDMISVPVTQNQFDALVSFAFNVGLGNLKKSQLLRSLNAGDIEGAAGQFGRWARAGGRELPDLVMRREKERELFLS